MDRAALLDNYYPFAAYRVRKSPKPPSSSSSQSHEHDDAINNEEEAATDYVTRFFDNIVARASKDVSRLILSRYPTQQGLPTSSTQKSLELLGEKGNNNINGNADFYKEEEVEEEEEEEEEEVEESRRKLGWSRYLSFKTYPTFMWVMLQLSWRVLLSLMSLFLIYYLVTKPPPPHVSVKTEEVHQFELTQGLDNYGLVTKLLSCNYTLGIVIDNKSKIFGLHVHPPLLEMTFSRLPLAFFQGPRVFAPRKHRTELKLSTSVTKKPMYGAGPTMEDLLRSRNGLSLAVRLTFESNFRVLGRILNPTFHHEARCALVSKHPANYNHAYTTAACNMIISS